VATATVNYGSTTDSTALSITLASQATSSTMVAGRQSPIVSNASTKALDYRVFGQITTGTSPTTGKTIAIYVFAPAKFASSSFNYPFAGATELAV
jgi:hypothetical protein